MKYFHLVWAALFRRKTRTFLTLASIVAAFLLFGLLDGIRSSFAQLGQNADGAQRLQTASKLSFIETLPISLQGRIANIDNIEAVTYANWFGGTYQGPKNQLFTFAVAPNYLDLYPEILVDPAEVEAWKRNRTGMLVGETMMKRFDWKVGQRVPLQSSIFPNSDGSLDWAFDIVGVLRAKDKKSAGFTESLILMHYDYFEESTPYVDGDVGWYISRVSDVRRSDAAARAIDALSANSPHETKSMSEQAAMASQLKQMADIGLIVGSIMGAVFFTLLLLTGNTMAQAVRERTSELAVLKTIGFSSSSVLCMVLAESMLIVVIGGVLGLALAAVIGPAASAGSGGMISLPPVGLQSWMLGLALMLAIGLLVGALPAIRAMRLNIVDALAGR
ncbi:MULTISPECIES: ABC transporter permease [unclassified Luteimonas]|uniref:ABC transporter permease n=1 Tax=unclassified Luteimonas TaxID=2629088 RepID=UPI0018F0C213|nr:MULTISPECIES: ABC transporter permease [unclassified Luteimonas]MBJ6981595.1 ABC transporter permease [Luteimonas sp. MC1572]MBJ7575838.1 ABC transporter permease [Luteimonas sp. MC1828]QQO02893.1 ABC transporter permease [Luteimonas sp. MC1572]